MATHSLSCSAEGRVRTTSHGTELLAVPPMTAERYNWRDVHGTALAVDFKQALKRLEGLMYVIWGGQPNYTAGKQWHERENPRCRWAVEQWWPQPTDTPPPDYLWNYERTAERGELRGGAFGPAVPVRSRSGDPAYQFATAAHSAHFPRGSVERYCGSIGNTGTAHDPASTFKQFDAWPNAQDVVIRYTEPGGDVPAATAVEVMHTGGTAAMTEVSPGVWEATIDAETQGTWVDWYVRAQFVDAPSTWRYDPLNGAESPVLAGEVADPEHGRLAGSAYSFVFYSHYNPYSGGLPELLDEHEPHEAGNWLRRGTDAFQFDSSENIPYELINLCRFVLDNLAGPGPHGHFQHSPLNRGSEANCCIDMPLAWRWSGANVPDLYRSGGKAGGDGVRPLHNNPTEDYSPSTMGLERRTWRGIEMAWRGAAAVPGYFDDNWDYGDTESWLAPPKELALDQPAGELFPAIWRDYRGRGLRDGDVIDPVHVREIIEAVDYLITHGVWTWAPVSTAKRTPGSMFGLTCGSWSLVDASGSDGGVSDGPAPKCCIGSPGTCEADYPKPTWEQCTGGCSPPDCYSGKCWASYWQERDCFHLIDFTSNTTRHYTSLDCGFDPGLSLAGTMGAFVWSWHTCPYAYPLEDDYRWEAHDQRELTGLSYWLCAPPRNYDGPDLLHGNTFRLLRRKDSDPEQSLSDFSMGNRLGTIETCHELGPGELPDIDFKSVVGIAATSVAPAWFDDQLCDAASETAEPPYEYLPDVPGLGQWNYAQTDRLSSYDNDGANEECGGTETSELEGLVDVTAWPVCRGEAVFVSLDLNLDEDGVPQLYDYDLEIPDPPDDDCPCKTWTGPTFCE